MNEPLQEQTTAPETENEERKGNPIIGWTIVIAALAIVGTVLYTTVGSV